MANLTAAQFDAAVAAGWLYGASLNQPENLVPALPDTILNYPSIKLMTDAMYNIEFGSLPTSAISEADFQTLYDDVDNGLQTVSVVLLDFEQAGLCDDEAEIATTLDNARAVFGNDVRIGWYVTFGYDPGSNFTANTQAQSNALVDTHEAAWGDKADFITTPTYRYTQDSYMEYGRRTRHNLVALARMTPPNFCWIGMNDNVGSAPYDPLSEEHLTMARTLAMELADGILLWWYGPGTGNGYPFNYSNKFDEMFAVGPDTTSDLGPHYDEATLNADPNATVRDAKLVIDFSDMSQQWWDNVASDGSDIRMVKDDGTRLPLAVVEFDYDNQTGEGLARIPGETTTAPTLRCHCGSGVALDDWHEHGNRASWADGSIYHYYHDGVNDATPEADHCTAIGTTSGTGPVGSATVYNGTSDRVPTPNAIDMENKPWIMAMAVKPTSVDSVFSLMSIIMSESANQRTSMHMLPSWEPDDTNFGAFSYNSTGAVGYAPTSLVAGEWQTVFTGFISNTERWAGRNGVRGDTNTESKSSWDADQWNMGAYYNPQAGTYNSWFPGSQSDVWFTKLDPGDAYFELWNRTLLFPETALPWSAEVKQARRVKMTLQANIIVSVETIEEATEVE